MPRECSDSAIGRSGPPSAELTLAVDRCDVVVATARLTCGSPQSRQSMTNGSQPDKIIADTGNFVQIVQAAAAYDGVGLLSVPIAIRNLTSQALGTADGRTVDPGGVRVFMHSGPTITSGSGEVLLRLADATNVFESSSTSFFQYDEIIQRNSTSRPRIWGFTYQPTVVSFSFEAYVSARLQDEVSPTTTVVPPASLVSQGPSALHSCSTALSAQTFCWGNNALGQLGLTRDPNIVIPQPLPGVRRYASMAKHMGSTTCGLPASGAPYCWTADNSFGQVGGGVATSGAASSAVALPAGVTVAAMDVSIFHACAISPTGDAYCWGRNDSGQLGDGSTTMRTAPVLVHAAVGVKFRAISTGDFHTCATSTVGDVYCWGLDDKGQLGDGGNQPRLTPTRVQLPVGLTALSVSAGAHFTCSVSSNGAAYCWGTNSNGQIGDGSNTAHSTPFLVINSTGLSLATIAAGNYATCALNTAGVLYCWGGPQFATPQLISSGPFKALAIGGPFPDAERVIDLGGFVYCGYGRNIVQVPTPNGVRFTSVAIGSDAYCGVGGDERVFCWGPNAGSEFGDAASPAQSRVPLPVQFGTFTSLAAGESHTCGISSGVTYCWGDNSQGQIGDGTGITRYSPTPVTLPSGVSSFTSVTAGAFHTCGVANTGELWCWGADLNGQLGDGVGTVALAPRSVQVPSGTTFIGVSAGAKHTCAISTAGAGYCWGNNAAGQLGDGSTNGRSVPGGPITLPGAPTRVAAGGTHTCWLIGSAAYCHGENGGGQLGDGTTQQRLAATAVLMPGSAAFTSLSLGLHHSCALTTTGDAYCWGENTDFQIGDPGGFPFVAPYRVGIPGGVALSAIGAGRYHTCATTTAGRVVCWGRNVEGQLGIGYNQPKSTPIGIAGP